MNRSTLLGLSICFALAAVPTISQQIPAGNVRMHIQGIQIPPVGDAPFTAKVVVRWDRPLVGGGTNSQKYYTLVARDSQGRVRREIRAFVPADSTVEPPLRSFTILDPVAGTRTVCTMATMTCAVSAFNANLALSQNNSDRGNTSSESLGQLTIDGLPTTGTRETVSRVTGPRGSSQVAVSHTEAWHSPDLQMDLSVTRTDPQSGVVTLDVTDLVQGEPDSNWFTIPPGYTIKGSKTQ